MYDVLVQMAILFLLVIAGFIANKCKLMGREFDRSLANFVINLSCPCLILSSVMGETMPDKNLILPLLIIGFSTYILLLLAALVIPRMLNKDVSLRGMYSFMLMFGNVGFIGYPIVASIFGNEAIFYASLLNVPNTLFIFTFGTIFVVGGEQGIRFNPKVLLCPAMIASYLSVIIVAAGINYIPQVISTPCRLLGNITVPGALLIIGSSMAQMPKRRMLGSPSVFIMSAFRLMILPISLYFLFRAIGANQTINEINTIIIGMPVASFGTMFCIKYGKDETTMVQGTFITTLLSMLSIPLLTSLF